MPEPAAANGSGSAELSQLREIIIGDKLDQLAALQDRLDDPAKHAADVSRVLPDAIRAAKAKTLREAIEPVFEKAFENSVRRHPKDLADAIYPVIGPAIRNSIAASIREFAGSLNQMVETSASFRAIKWRIEARMTGKPFAEILLARSLLYSVEQVFLIHRKSGLLLMHVAAKDSVLKDADMIAGMLTAIQDFFNDSFTEGGQNLETVDAGRFRLWIQHGPRALVVGAVSGTPPTQLTNVFRNAIDKVHQELYAQLDTFRQDDVSVFEPARPYLEACLLGQSASSKKKLNYFAWIGITLLLLLIGGGIWFRVSQSLKWNKFFDHLKHEPGFAVTAITRDGSYYTVTGLRDPMAKEAITILRQEGLDPEKVTFEWMPYLSLNTPWEARRDLDAEREFIESQLVRFESGSSTLPLTELGLIDQTAVRIARLLRAHSELHVTLTGRTDEVGNAAMNAKLSNDRVNKVVEGLVGQGVPRDRIDIVAVGAQLPLRPGTTEWDRAANRSVSFKVQ